MSNLFDDQDKRAVCVTPRKEGAKSTMDVCFFKKKTEIKKTNATPGIFTKLGVDSFICAFLYFKALFADKRGPLRQ